MTRTRCLALLLCLANPTWGQPPQPTLPQPAQPQSTLQLTLPTEIPAVTGIPTSVYFDNVMLTQSLSNYRIEVTCGLGLSDKRRWTITPTVRDIGSHRLRVSVYSANGELLESSACVLRILSDSLNSAAETKRLLIIGDSLTHASVYPNELARMLSRHGAPAWEMLGTHRPLSAAGGVAHEGYGGWTWSTFVSKYEPNPDGTHRKRSSPFVFLNQDANPQLDMQRYFQDNCAGQRPDYVVIMLGINDCFGAPPEDPAGIDARIDTMLGHADRLLKAIRQAAPRAHIGICLTTPPNARQEAFAANYQDRYTRWGWKRIQHRLVQRQLEYVQHKADSRISIVPTQLNLDPINGYPADNGVHPNATGYRQIAATIYCWLMRQLAETSDGGHRD